MKKTVRQIYLVLILGVVAVGAACQKNSFNSSPSAHDDGRRPSEQGEGVIGYLRDPENLEYERRDGRIRIRGGENAVARYDGGTPASMAICLQTIGTQTLIDRTNQQDKRFGGQDVDTLAVSTVNPDGSFVLESSDQQVSIERILTINATGRCASGAEATVTGANQIVFMSPDKEGVFSSDATMFIAIGEIKKQKPSAKDVTESEPSPALSYLFCNSQPSCKAFGFTVFDSASQTELNPKFSGSVVIDVFPLGESCIVDEVSPVPCQPLETYEIATSGTLFVTADYRNFSVVIRANKYTYLPWVGEFSFAVDQTGSELSFFLDPLSVAVAPATSTSTSISFQ